MPAGCSAPGLRAHIRVWEQERIQCSGGNKQSGHARVPLPGARLRSAGAPSHAPPHLVGRGVDLLSAVPTHQAPAKTDGHLLQVDMRGTEGGGGTAQAVQQILPCLQTPGGDSLRPDNAEHLQQNSKGSPVLGSRPAAVLVWEGCPPGRGRVSAPGAPPHIGARQRQWQLRARHHNGFAEPGQHQGEGGGGVGHGVGAVRNEESVVVVAVGVQQPRQLASGKGRCMWGGGGEGE